MNKDMIRQMMGVDNLERIVEQLAVQIPMSMTERQSLLEEYDFVSRYEQLSTILANEISVIRIKKDIQNKVKEKVDQNQKEYILREQLKVIREELGENNTIADADLYLEQTKALIASKEVKERICKEIERFKTVANSSSESAVERSYIETLLDMPWDRASKDREDIGYVRKSKGTNLRVFGSTNFDKKGRCSYYLSGRAAGNWKDINSTFGSPCFR